MEYIYFVILLGLAAYGLWRQLIDGEVWFLLSIIAVTFFIAPILIHISDLTQIKVSDEKIAIHTKYRDTLIEKLNNIPEVEVSLMNADAPLKSLIIAIQEAEEGIGMQRLRRVAAERSILSTKLGPNAFVLWFYDERI